MRRANCVLLVTIKMVQTLQTVVMIPYLCYRQEETLLKPKLRRKRRLSDSSNSGQPRCKGRKCNLCGLITLANKPLSFILYIYIVDNDDNTPMDIYAPLESDIDENANSVPELKVRLIIHSYNILQ